MYPPGSKLARVVDAAVEPLSLDQAKKFLRVEVPDDDDLIGDLITAARLQCEQMNDRSFITTTWSFTINSFPSGGNWSFGYTGWPFGQSNNGGSFDRVSRDDGSIVLPMPPLISVISISYLDQTGNQTLFNVQNGNLGISPGTPGLIFPSFGSYFPTIRSQPGAVQIVYTAGYGGDPSNVPKSIVTAIRYLVAHMYEHRTDSVAIPDVVANLLAPTAWGGYA